jgi:hypothetical protein
LLSFEGAFERERFSVRSLATAGCKGNSVTLETLASMGLYREAGAFYPPRTSPDFQTRSVSIGPYRQKPRAKLKNAFDFIGKPLA